MRRNAENRPMWPKSGKVNFYVVMNDFSSRNIANWAFLPYKDSVAVG